MDIFSLLSENKESKSFVIYIQCLVQVHMVLLEQFIEFHNKEYLDSKSFMEIYDKGMEIYDPCLVW